MRACWLKWVGRDWSISADYIWLNYSGANIRQFTCSKLALEASVYLYQSGKSTWNTVSDGDSIAGDGLLPDCRYRKKDD